MVQEASVKSVALLALAVGTAIAPATTSIGLAADAVEILRASDLMIPRPFKCGGVQPAGRYTLEAYGPAGENPGTLKILQGEKVLCVIKASPHDPTYDSLSASKVRIFTSVNDKAKEIEVDVVLPTQVRSSVPNQRYSIPLASGR